MFYKLSNTAPLQVIERAFDKKYEYPNLFESSPVINGLKESTLSIITANKSTKIQFAIWGLLPEDFEDNWDVFQNVTNTLNVNLEQLNKSDPFYNDALNNRRCLIIVTGFFTSYLHNGSIQPYHIHLKNHEPFCIAGVYNKLNDGFLTSSILITNVYKSFIKIPNLSIYKPLIIKPELYSDWLDENQSFSDLQNKIEKRESYNFESHPIKKDGYDNEATYNKISKALSKSHSY